MGTMKSPLVIAAAFVAVAVAVTGCSPASTDNAPDTGQVAPTTGPVATATPPESGETGQATPPAPVATADGGYVAPTQAPAPAPEAEPAPAPQPAPESAGSNAAALLAMLTVAEEQNGGTYNRDLFPHWSTLGDGCSVRESLLTDEAAEVVSVRNCVTTGTWMSAYDGQTFTNPGDLDIDHMIPLKEAWLSGAWAWDTPTREAFANDLNFEPSLIVVSASSNRSKGDRDPSEWMPASMDACQYGIQWMQVKVRWGLAVDAGEHQALSQIASTCGSASASVPPLASVVEGDAPQSAPQPAPAPAPEAGTGGNDPQFPSCKDAKAAGFGPYVSGQDAEYAWYRDGDGDGTVCE